jgi:D-3-phosphoglycerate dehydrogenase / 2-oxoglutarate reductase
VTRILVTPRSLTEAPHAALDRLRAAGFEVVASTPGRLPDEAELVRLVPGCAGWLAGVEPVSDRVIEVAAELRAISRNGSGVDNLPMATLAGRGILVLTAAGANAASVAELTIALMLAGLRHIPFADAGIKSGRWPRRRGREIRNLRIGIIGCGAVGKEVARLALALGACVTAHDPVTAEIDFPPDCFHWGTFADVLNSSEVISLHRPSEPDGKAVFDAETFGRIRPGAVLVNTARASLVDEVAVLDALSDGRLDVYATDVFEEEPPKHLTLAGHPRVIATSHIGGYTEESIDRAVEAAVTNLLGALKQTAVHHAG